MIRLHSRVAIAVLAVLMASACDAPWAGPSLPNGGHWVTYRPSRAGPFGCNTTATVIAGNTLAEIRTKVQADCRKSSACERQPSSCWQGLAEEPGNFYIAVVLFYECNRAVKDNVAVSNRTLYYIHWVGSPHGVCNAAMAVPSYSLFLVPRSELPGAGPLTVELQIQTQDQPTESIDTQVDLS
jgi:hypothetical protein